MEPVLSRSRTNRWLLLLASILAVSRLALAFRPEIRIVERPYQEDSFFLLNCAHHLAEGQGLSVDGLHLTNGVQPLMVFLYVPWFWIAGADKWLAVRLTFVLAAALEVCSMYLIAKIVERLSFRRLGDAKTASTLAIIGAGLWVGLLRLMQQTTNGLETGLFTSLILMVVYYTSKIDLFHEREISLRQSCTLGVILGLVVLARIDGVFLVAGVVLSDLYFARKTIDSRRIKRILLYGTIAILVSSPWWFYNYFWFGSLMPISGQSESLRNMFVLNLLTLPQVVGDILSTFFYTPFYSTVQYRGVIWFVLNLVALLFVLKRTKVQKVIARDNDLRPLMPLALFCIALTVYYVGFFSSPHFLSRYLHPLDLLWLIVFILAVPHVIATVKEFYGSTGKIKRVLLSGGLFLIAGAAIWFNVTRYTLAFTLDHFGCGYIGGVWANQHKDGAVGMTSSGIAGFEAANVVNLDGKVNLDALHARQKNALTKYVVESGIKYIADEKNVDSLFQAEAAKLGAHFVYIDSLKWLYILKRTDSVASTAKNKRLWRPI